MNNSKCEELIIKSRNETEPPPPKLEASNSNSWLRYPISVITGLCFVLKFLITAARGFITLMAIAAYIMRYRRATAESSSTPIEPLIPGFWRRLNGYSMKYLKMEIIPKSFYGEGLTSSTYEKNVKVLGLNGHRSSSEKNLLKRENSKSRSIRRTASGSDLLKDRNNDFNNTKTNGKLSWRKRRKGVGYSGKFDEIARDDNDTCTNIIPESSAQEYLSPVLDSMDENKEESHGIENNDIICMTIDEDKEINPRLSLSQEFLKAKDGILSGKEFSISRRSLMSDCSSISSDHREDIDEDGNDSYWALLNEDKVCKFCMKRYKVFKRWKHHCCRCAATFCHKHGHVTHSGIVPCRVPGDCICQSCFDLAKIRKNQ